MAQYPINTPDALYEAVNYLASGPSGLGQNFQGFSDYFDAYLTGNFRRPYSVTSSFITKVSNGVIGEFTVTVPDTDEIQIGSPVTGTGIGTNAIVVDITGLVITLSVANTNNIINGSVTFSTPPRQINILPIACSAAYQLGPSTFKYEFASPQLIPPFQLGNNLYGSGWSNNFYNDSQGGIGVIECTTTYAIFQVSSLYPGTGDDLGGGFVEVYNMNADISTDCNARVTVLGGTDRVFISAQLNNQISYVNPGAASELTYYVAINRYKGYPNDNPINPDFLFSFDATVFRETYYWDSISGSGTFADIETLFTTVLDQPGPGYYWYILDIRFEIPDGSQLYITTCKVGNRTMSVQVVKQ